MPPEPAVEGARARSLLVRESYARDYERLLRQNLPREWASFSRFFADTSRLHTLARMLRDHLPDDDRRVLNVGSGPFASEIFVAALQERSVVSFDYTREFAKFFNIFRGEGLLSNVMFARADALTVEFAPHSFGLVILHDILYEPSIDLAVLLKRLDGFLAPGGHLYLDFMNQRTRWLWTLLGKERRYRRYVKSDVLDLLRRAGFEIVDQGRAGSSSGRLAPLFHEILQRVFRTSNSVAVLARKNDAGAK